MLKVTEKEEVLEKYNVLNKTLDIWEAENLSKDEVNKRIRELRLKELDKLFSDYKYEYEIILEK